jgi:hypothetical protein
MSYNLTGAAFGGNISLGKAGLSAGSGTSPNYAIATAITYANKGQLYTLAAATGAGAAAPTLDCNTGLAFKPLAAGESCIFAFYANVAGQVQVAQGQKVATLDLTGQLGAAQFPQSDDSRTPFGYCLASASAALAAPWTFGTNNMQAITGLTLTFRDVMDFPAQPITG